MDSISLSDETSEISSIDSFSYLTESASESVTSSVNTTTTSTRDSETRKKVESDVTTAVSTDDDYDMEKHMLEEHTYPSPSQENFQELFHTKRDFIMHSIPPREKVTTYAEKKELRDKICVRKFKFSETQILLSNFINPNTPYRGVLIYHGTGVGKTGAAVAIAENFKPMVEKYGTRIHVLVPGSFHKQNFFNEIIKYTGETYMKLFRDNSVVINESDISKLRKTAINHIKQYYNILSNRSFYKRVLGEKIREKVVVGDKIKMTNKKTDTGEYDRDFSTDRIYNLDNTILIIDEAHNLTDNEYGNAVKKIIQNSKNLRVVIMTATPMKNLADDIIELLNYIRPPNHPIERDKIFTSQRGHAMEFKPNGKENLRKMVRGYVSYLRGADPITFAERVDIGVTPPGLSFSKVTRCFMLPFQEQIYRKIVDSQDDSLDRKSGAVANFVFPGLPKQSSRSTEDNVVYLGNAKNRAEQAIAGYYGIEGMNEVRNQLKHQADAVTKRIASTVLAEYGDIPNPSTLMYLTENNKVISGDIFHEKYLKHFSIKFYNALIDMNRMNCEEDGAGLLFVYCNLVKVGIDIFQEVLKQNGYLEFQESMSNYAIRANTRCYYCNHPYHQHKKLPEKIPFHEFYPATFVSVTGKADEVGLDNQQIPEEKFRLISEVFVNPQNKYGKFLKIIIGSRVINEGITLKNIKNIYILEMHYNLGRVDQAIGRGIRFCVHYDVTTVDNPTPKVEIRKYVTSIKNELSSEELMYQKAEQKYRLMKEVERILQEEAIDCSLNYNGNIFPEELERYGDCGTKDNPCPAICGYMPCQYKCGDQLLNSKYYDPERNVYKKVAKENLDYSTYNNSLAREEIEYAKTKIKELFRLDVLYTLSDILKYVKKSYPSDKRDMFDDYYVYQALDDLIPVTSNDFNNFRDTLLDKQNRPGYLLYRNRYYIFQLFDENEELPIYYRKNYVADIHNKLSLKNYIKNTKEFEKYKDIRTQQTESVAEEKEADVAIFVKSYDFDSILEYYGAREEFEYIGIIDQESQRKGARLEDTKDEFKIRIVRPKVLIKKREIGVPSFKGAVCRTSKDRQFLSNVAQKLGLYDTENKLRTDICDMIRDKLFDMEKYATDKDKNKRTYLIVPANHPVIPFPLNLEDRTKTIIDGIQRELRVNIDPKVEMTKIKKGRFPDIKYASYTIVFSKDMEKHADVLELYGAIKNEKTGNREIIIE